MDQLNHYVLLVGYDASTNFIYKNSFGTGWGDQGYGTFKHNYDCGIRIVSYEFFGVRGLWAPWLLLLLLAALFGL